MIFGFHTDVKHGDTICHVQSEAREGERLLEAEVFVRGCLIGRKANFLCGPSPSNAIRRKFVLRRAE